jgi:hypothetical protein
LLVAKSAARAALASADDRAACSAGCPTKLIAALNDWTPVNRLRTWFITPTRLSALLSAAARVCCARL